MTDPLASWRPGKTRDAIIAFVEAVTAAGGREFVPSAERIAVFDNDGTLWCEQPAQVQVIYAMARIREEIEADPSLADDPVYRALLEKDFEALHALGRPAVFRALLELTAGSTVAEATERALAWLRRTPHPMLKRPCIEVVYQPQLELLAYLRYNGFKTFIVSGGGVDFMRSFSEAVYGVPPEQVIGSSVSTEMVAARGGGLQLLKQPHLLNFDDREEKVRNIGLHIGCRPILAVGNSDGDLAMMRYTLAGPGRRLALLTHHDDDEREKAYDRDFALSPLVEALDRADEHHLTVISVKDDWESLFPPVAPG